MSKINYYNEDLKYADSIEMFNKVNEIIYLKMYDFIPIKDIRAVNDIKLQYQGVDKLLVTNSGKILRLEEKIRRKNWGDILIELVADNRFFLNFESQLNSSQKFVPEKLRGLGWGLKDYKTDLLFYYFEDTHSGFLFSWKKFRYVLLNNLPLWYSYAKDKKFGFALKKAKKNNNYYSLNIAIPEKRLITEYNKIGKVL